MARLIPSVPIAEGSDRGGWVKKTADAVNAILNGRRNNVTALTLTANAASTTLTDARIHPDSHLDLTPRTANAAAALATTYISARTTGSATITHANNAQTDRTFTVEICG